MAQVESICHSCDGSGVYRGYAEPSGIGVICRNCKGEGKYVIEYVAFKGRRRRNDINEIFWSAGTSIDEGIGPTGKSVTYEEFFNGKKPE